MGGAKKDPQQPTQLQQIDNRFGQLSGEGGPLAPTGPQIGNLLGNMGGAGPNFQQIMGQMGGQPPATGGPTPMQPGLNDYGMPNAQWNPNGGPGGAPMGPADPQQRCPMCGK